MRRFLPWLTVLVLALLVRGAAAEEFKIIRVDDLAKLMDAKTPKLVIYDANPASTRDSEGIIPGAKLLPGLSFDPDKVLPADHASKLVFYCANTH